MISLLPNSPCQGEGKEVAASGPEPRVKPRRASHHVMAGKVPQTVLDLIGFHGIYHIPLGPNIEHLGDDGANYVEIPYMVSRGCLI